MGITLNSLTHGYAADRVAKILAERGVKQAFVDTGEMEVLGRNAKGRDWTAALKHPRQADAMLGTAPLTGCMATAGDYAYTWSEDFSRHHILDPRTGYSPASFACVSVIAEKAVLADALSTAISVVGPGRGAGPAAPVQGGSLWRDQAGRGLGESGFPEAEFGVRRRKIPKK